MFFTVCGLWSQEAIPETLKPAPEKNIILDIQSIIIHPDFVPGQVHCSKNYRTIPHKTVFKGSDVKYYVGFPLFYEEMRKCLVMYDSRDIY